MDKNRINEAKMNMSKSNDLSGRIQNFSILPDEALLTAREIIQLTGRSRTSLWRDVNSERLPKPIKLAPNSIRWSVRDIKSYLSGYRLQVNK